MRQEPPPAGEPLKVSALSFLSKLLFTLFKLQLMVLGLNLFIIIVYKSLESQSTMVLLPLSSLKNRLGPSWQLSKAPPWRRSSDSFALFSPSETAEDAGAAAWSLIIRRVGINKSKYHLRLRSDPDLENIEGGESDGSNDGLAGRFRINTPKSPKHCLAARGRLTQKAKLYLMSRLRQLTSEEVTREWKSRQT